MNQIRGLTKAIPRVPQTLQREPMFFFWLYELYGRFFLATKPSSTNHHWPLCHRAHHLNRTRKGNLLSSNPWGPSAKHKTWALTLPSSPTSQTRALGWSKIHYWNNKKIREAPFLRLHHEKPSVRKMATTSWFIPGRSGEYAMQCANSNKGSLWLLRSCTQD